MRVSLELLEFVLGDALCVGGAERALDLLELLVARHRVLAQRVRVLHRSTSTARTAYSIQTRSCGNKQLNKRTSSV